MSADSANDVTHPVHTYPIVSDPTPPVIPVRVAISRVWQVDVTTGKRHLAQLSKLQYYSHQTWCDVPEVIIENQMYDIEAARRISPTDLPQEKIDELVAAVGNISEVVADV